MSLREDLDYKLEEGESICIFNVYAESSQLNSFAEIHTIVRIYQTCQYVTVIFKENVNTKQINKNAK